jgi:hypothetical protein
MKFAFVVLFANLTPLACAIGAVLLALNGIGVWGWFLCASLLLTQTISCKDTENKE